MNKIFSLNMLVLLLTLLAGCASDPVFPDPGFDLLTDKKIVIRRDTADSYTIALNVKAPAGIDNIQILNGRTFDVLEELPQYKGKKDFLFNYRLNFDGIDKNRDTVLIYNVRIQTLDERAFNSSFKIDLKKLSVPEIMLPNNEVIGTTVPLVSIIGLASTGIYKISSLKIYVNGEEKYVVPQEELAGKSEYRFETNIYYPFEVGREDLVSIELADERNQKKRTDITVKGIEPKRVRSLRVTEDNKPYGYMNFEYNGHGQIVKIISICSAMSTTSFSISFEYNQEGQVKHCDYYLTDYPNTMVYIDFNYVNGVLHDAKHIRYYVDNPSDISVYDDFQNFKYRADGTVQSYDVGITTIKEVQYANGFVEGEKLFAEKWNDRVSRIPLGSRQIKTGFVPVINPIYIKGMPPIWAPYWFGNELTGLCWYKYMYISDAAGSGNTEAPTKYRAQYEYTCDESGQLQTFTWKREKSSYWRTYYYEYYE